MWFNFLTLNHGGSMGVDGLTSMTNYMRGTLSKCGHETTVVFGELINDAVNIFFERFEDPVVIQQILQTIRDRSMKVGIVATELMIGGAIPYAKHGIKYYGNVTPGLLEPRMAGFATMAGSAHFLWSFLERTAEEYKSVCPVSEFFPVGHVGGMAPDLRRSPKDIDLVFFGKSTPHRAAIAERFAAAGIRGIFGGDGFSTGFVPRIIQESLLERAKIGLNLTLHARDDSVNGIDPRFVSCMRVTEMLDRELCIVSEEIPLDNPYREFMVSAEPDKLAGVCKDLLQSGQWKQRGKEMAAAYREKMDVRKICGPVIERTLTAIGMA